MLKNLNNGLRPLINMLCLNHPKPLGCFQVCSTFNLTLIDKLSLFISKHFDVMIEHVILTKN